MNAPEQEARGALISALDDFEGLELAAREAAGIVPQSVIPILPSPFTSSEGASAWEAALTAPVAAAADTDKKGGAAGAKKAAAPDKKDAKKDKDAASAGVVPVVDAAQANAFYLQMHRAVVASILDSLVENMFSVVDAALNESIIAAAAARQADTASSAASTGGNNTQQSAASRVAVVRQTDIPRNGVVFLSCSGAAFLSSSLSSSLSAATPSAFDIYRLQREQAAEQVLLASQGGARAVVLVFESSSAASNNNTSPSSSSSPSPAAGLISSADVLPCLQTTLDAAAQRAAESKERQRPRPRKKDPPLPRIPPETFNTRAVRSFAELDASLALLYSDDKSTPASFPVLVLEDLRSPSIVPEDLPLPDEVSDDESCPIPIGIDEHRAKRAADWKRAGPKHVSVQISSGETVKCLAGVAEALYASITNCAKRAAAACLWVDAAPSTLFEKPSCSALQRCAAMAVTPSGRLLRVAAPVIRDVCVWADIASQFKRVPGLLASIQGDDSSHFEFSGAASDRDLALHARTLFGGAPPSSLRFSVVIGGFARIDKFLALDRLLDAVSSVFLGGEMCIPFLPFLKDVTLHRYQTICDSFDPVCREIIRKARMRGVSLIVPSDVIEGDEAVSAEQRALCLSKCDPGARDEGGDYSGESKTVSLPDYSVANGVYSRDGNQVVSGYILDIGQSTCQALKQLVESSHLLLSWGPLGCCEMAAFQGSQRLMVASAVKKPYSEDDEAAAIAANNAKMPLHSVVIGDSGAEWWARIADSEGEFKGELARVGIVACLSRNSNLFAGLISNCASSLYSGLCRRPAEASEWIYNARPPAVPEEEEEEDDEDD